VKRAAVAEDDDALRARLSRLLRAEGFKVTELEDVSSCSTTWASRRRRRRPI